MEKTKIDWCDSTWNPVSGCYHGCEYCYARGIANRFSGGGDKRTNDNLFVLDKRFYKDEEEKACPYPYGFKPTFHRYKLDEYANKKGKNIFVCSMADLFGDWVPDNWILEVFQACRQAKQHRYLFLTKNPKRYLTLANQGLLPKEDSFWYGQTITKASDSYIDLSEEGIKWFLSIEPILEPINLPNMPNWVIIGAETGRRKGKVVPKREWIENLAQKCQEENVPVFMKASLTEIWEKPLVQKFPWG